MSIALSLDHRWVKRPGGWQFWVDLRFVRVWVSPPMIRQHLLSLTARNANFRGAQRWCEAFSSETLSATFAALTSSRTRGDVSG